MKNEYCPVFREENGILTEIEIEINPFATSTYLIEKSEMSHITLPTLAGNEKMYHCVIGDRWEGQKLILSEKTEEQIWEIIFPNKDDYYYPQVYPLTTISKIDHLKEIFKKFLSLKKIKGDEWCWSVKHSYMREYLRSIKIYLPDDKESGKFNFRPTNASDIFLTKNPRDKRGYFDDEIAISSIETSIYQLDKFSLIDKNNLKNFREWKTGRGMHGWLGSTDGEDCYNEVERIINGEYYRCDYRNLTLKDWVAGKVHLIPKKFLEMEKDDLKKYFYKHLECKAV